MPGSYGFTGQHADSTTGLDYYGARYYDPLAAQFTSADTVLPGGGFDPWGLSRYAYVEGNPLVRTDPTGHNWWSSVTSTVSAVAQVALPVVGQVLDATTGIPSMVHDVQTLFDSHASTADKLMAGGDLLINAVSDATMVIGVGEGVRAAYLAGKAADKVGMDLAKHVVTHVIKDALGHEEEHAADELYRQGVNQANRLSRMAGEEGLQRALMPKEDQAYAVARKFNINLRGRKLMYAPDEFGVGQLGKTAKANPWVIKLSREAYTDERTLASTIAHELRHSRDYVNYGWATEEAGQQAERGFLRWYDGLR